MRSLRLNALGKIMSAGLTLMMALLMVPAAAFAQVETGQVSGTVTDPQGAVVSGASVTVRSTTGAERSVTTSGDGNFLISNLQPGSYEVKIEASGFGTKKVPVQVSVGTRTALSVELAIAGSDVSVDVVAGEAGVQVNTENQVLQTVVSERELKELPTITRNPYALVTLSGNVSPADPSGRGAGFAINGQRAASTNVLLDGSDNNDQFTASTGQNVPLDSVQEFSVLTSNFSAEFGRAGGGIVNVATKSGSNEYHGTAYEFNRISKLASRGFDLNAQYPPTGTTELPKGVFTRNQFGYSIGGPVIKDKLLFFNNIEWIRVRSADTVTTLVPTAEFIANTDPATQAFFGSYSLAAPISGRLITRGEIGGNPGGPFASLPAGLPVFGEVFQSVPTDAGGGNPQNSYEIVGRADWNINDKMTLYARYALEDQSFLEGSNAFSPYQGFNTGATNFNNNILVSLTRVWADNFVSQSKFVYNRLNNSQPLGDQPVGPTLYFNTVRSSIGGTNIALPGYLPFNPGSAIPFGGPQNLAQFYQDQTWTIGNHSIRFGGSYVRIQDDRTFGAYQNAVATLGSSLFSGLDNLVLGRVRRFQVAVDPKGAFPFDTVSLPLSQPQFFRNNRYNEFAFYVNDSWKIHPRVTLNLGLRYDYFGVQHNKDRSLDSNFYYGAGSTLQERVANGRIFRTQDSPIGDLWNKDGNNFGPRVGIAWDVFGDGKTSLRGGYGISYERNFGNVTFNVIQNPPNYAVLFITAGDPGFPTIPISSNNLGPFTGSGNRLLPRTGARHVSQDIKTAYAHFWSAAVEHEFFDRFVASIEYSGSKGVDLYSLEDPNGPFSAIHYGFPFDPATNPLAYLNPLYSSINTRSNNGFSTYHGMTASIETRRLDNLGLQFQAKYTWSHSIDNLSSTFSESNNNFNLGILDPFNPEIDRGDADFDVRHRFVTSGIWDIPFARNTEGVAKYLLDGWQITYIYTARTGSPYTIFDCTNGFFRCNRLLQAGPISRDGADNPRAVEGANPNQFVFLDLTSQLPQAGAYFDPLTGVADYGPFPSNMTQRNLFRRPGFWNLDGGIYKNIPITERYNVQLRAEFYNVFNHANLFIDDSNADISAADFITAFKDGRRQVQLAVKFVF